MPRDPLRTTRTSSLRLLASLMMASSRLRQRPSRGRRRPGTNTVVIPRLSFSRPAMISSNRLGSTLPYSFSPHHNGRRESAVPEAEDLLDRHCAVSRGAAERHVQVAFGFGMLAKSSVPHQSTGLGAADLDDMLADLMPMKFAVKGQDAIDFGARAVERLGDDRGAAFPVGHSPGRAASRGRSREARQVYCHDAHK